MFTRVKVFFDYIGSRRFAVILLIFTASLMLITNLLPNPLLMSPEDVEIFTAERPLLHKISEVLNVMQITRRPAFLVVPFFIFSSITICTIKRIRRRVRKGSEDGIYRSFDTVKSVHICSIDEAEGILKRRGYRVSRKGHDDCLIVGIKGVNGDIGSYLFHLGMNIVIAGAIVSMLTLFNRKLDLTEGYEARPLEVLQQLTRSEIRSFPFEKMTLRSFSFLYADENFPLDYTAEVETIDRRGGVNLQTVKVNDPIKEGGFQFLLNEYYYAPRFVITDRNSGEIIEDAFIKLLVRGPSMTDEIIIKEISIAIKATFIPDFTLVAMKPATRSMNLKNPVFLLEFFKAGKKLGDGILPLGKRMDFDGGSYTVEFKELRKWIKLSISKDYGLAYVELGLLLVVLGLVVRFLLNEKRLSLHVRKEEGVLKGDIGGKAIYFPALFERELSEIGEELGLTSAET